jgi:Tc toxin complex TcA C-terminal TcB-binding domain/Neuraminidase-like domain/Salmonella virulence plasmid 28.1kDa A protein
MQAIQATIKPGDSGAEVANLQDALRLLLDRAVIRSLQPPNEPSPDELAKLGDVLGDERGQSQYGEATLRLVRILQIQHGLGDNLEGIVEERTAALINHFLRKLGELDTGDGEAEFVVRGRVTSAGAPVPNVIVRARDQDVRTFQALGDDARTDADGRYEIRYSREQFAAAEDGRPDVVIRVFGPGADPDRPLAESPPLFNAPPVALIDVELPGTDSGSAEFDRNLATIQPLLAGQGPDGGELPIGDLTEADAEFLAGDTGIPRAHIAWLGKAFAFASKLASDRHSEIPPALFYGWLREGQPGDLDQLLRQSTSVLRAAGRAAIAHGVISSELEPALEASLDAIPSDERDVLRTAVTLTGIPTEAATAILRNAGAVAEVSNELVADLVDRGDLSAAEAHGVGLAVAAHDVVDGDEAALKALLSADSARLDGKPRRATDLAALHPEEIEGALVAGGVEAPDGLSLAEYADRISRDVAERFPTDTLLHRVATVPDDVVESLKQIEGEPSGDSGRTDADPALRAFADLHPGLGLADVIDGATDGATALAAVRERVGWVDRVRALNPDLDLLSVDYLPDSLSLQEVKLDGLPEDAQPMIAETFKTYQRLGATGAGALDQLELLKAGYRSSTSLALSDPEEIAERTGLPLPRVAAYQAHAEERATNAAIAWFSFRDLERDNGRIKSGTVRPAPAYLQRLKGYADLFGSQTYCHCEHCHSVLGPAAYFVDLMYFVERNILDPSFKLVGGSQHALHLYQRRPDLWKLELTCANTTDVVPTLDLVNDLLAGYIVREKGLASTDALYTRLAGVDHSIKLPFSLPLERLSVWLGHLGIPRSEIAETLLLRASSDETRARIRLGMLPRQFDIVTTGRLGNLGTTAIQAAETYYSLWLKSALTLSTIAGQTETRALSPVDVIRFTDAIGVDMATAEAILTSAFVRGSATGAPAAVRFDRGIGTTGGVQNDTELVVNLTAGRLERVERFVRLWRHVRWTVRELDYVLGRLPGGLPAGGASSAVAPTVLVDLARLVAIQEQLHVTVDDLCALVDELPTVPVTRDTPLFDRLFSPAPDPNGTITADASIRARLGGVFQIDEADLTLLVDALDPCLGKIDTTGGVRTFVKGLWTNRRNLSLLYRYTRLARILGLSIDELLATVAFTPSVVGKTAADERCLLTLDDLAAVLDTHRWRAASDFDLSEIEKITAAPGTTDSAELAAQLVSDVAADRSLHVSAELFTQVGFTQTEAARLVADNYQPVGGNPALLEPIPGDNGSRLRAGVTTQNVDAWFRFDPEPRPEVVDQIAADVFAIVRRAGAAGFLPGDLTALGLSQTEAQTLVTANLSAATTDDLPFELVPGSTTRYRLRPAIAEADAVAAFGSLAANVDAARTILDVRARELVTRSFFDVAKEIFRIVREAGDAGFDPTALTELGLSATEATALVAANTSTSATDELPFEAVAGGPPPYRLRAAVSEAAAIAGFGSRAASEAADFAATKSILRHRAVDLLLRRHAENVLAAKAAAAVRVAPARVRPLLELALPSAAAARSSVVEALQGGDPAPLTAVLERLARYAILFRSTAFDAQALGFVAATPAALAFAWPPTGETVRRVAAYAKLAEVPDIAYEPGATAADAAALQTVLAWTGSVAATPLGTASAPSAEVQQLAGALRTDARHIQELLPRIELATTPAAPRIDELQQLAAALALEHRVGASADNLKLAASEITAEIGRAADGIRAAIRARYPDEASFQKKIEPFEDTLRSRTRDGLVEYLLSAPDDATTDWRKRFLSASDLYAWFLTDVLVEGCARTSKVVAATMTLQLYVHRAMLGLEVSTGPPVVTARFADAKKQHEWAFRKNYQIWVANRRVFLFPETYLEPGLRDDKTPLFKDLEDTLLQQEIGDATVEDAYGAYLTGLDELARLKIAGACYDGATDTLHVFGASHHEPPLYSYRRIDAANTDAPVAGPWRPLALQIPTRAVSPVLYEDRLYLFWLETTTRPVSTFVDGDSKFDGYRHSVRIRYSMLRADNAWTPAQGLRFEVSAATEDSRLVSDLVLPSDAARRDALEKQIKDATQRRNDFESVTVKKAADDATKARQAVTDAQAALGKPKTGAENAEEAGVATLAAAAAGVAYASSIIAGPIVAAAAAAAAAIAVVAVAVPATVAEMNAAGVGAGDGLISARRKVRLWRARQVSTIADQIYSGMLGVLAQLDAQLAALNAAKVVVSVRWDRSGRDHSEALENYRPEGWEWERVYPDVHRPSDPKQPSTLRLVLVPTDDANVGSDELDLFARLLRPVPDSGPTETLKRLSNTSGRITLVQTSTTREVGQEFFLSSQALNIAVTPGTDVAVTPKGSAVQAVNGAPATVVVESDGEPIWLRPRADGSYSRLRLGTSVMPALTKAFAQTGVDGLLNYGLQRDLTEAPSRIAVVGAQDKPESFSPFWKNNVYRPYYRETFFQIPFLIADHLNSQQRFAEAQRWYHRVFDPTAIDGFAWRYREFRELDPLATTLRATLTDPAALAAYRGDPFNPHAIARLRPGAYEKAIVMKYVDNLLDWGDSLFARFTMESVNEATMLYVMAADVLGPRPTQLAACGESEKPRTYESIAPLLRPAVAGAESTADFLIEEAEVFTLELGDTDRSTQYVTGKMKTGLQQFASTAAGGGPVLAAALVVPEAGFAPAAGNGEPGMPLGQENGIAFDGQLWKATEGTPLAALSTGEPIGGTVALEVGGAGNRELRVSGDPIDPPDQFPGADGFGVDLPRQGRKFGQFPVPKQLEPSDFSIDVKYDLRKKPPPTKELPGKKQPQPKPFELAKARLVFCFPENEELLSYWDRVDDRLNKIRNCLDISGVRRRLELFAPEIDPRLLVRMRAAGLSLDDVMNVTSGNLPPYRFAYLIEKAKQHASVVQAFGDRVLSALEKRDAEELTRLRTVHEQNLLQLRSKSVQLEIDAAEDTLASLQSQRTAAVYRREYFASLGATGLLASESKQQQLQQQAGGFRTMAGIAQMVASILTIIPDAGAPTAMKFGGSQLGAAGRAVAEGFNAVAAFTELGALMAGQEGSNRRREQEWEHQVEMARRDIAQLDKQIAAAEIRRDIAHESQKIHDRSLEQVEAIFDLLRERFTSFGLFTWLSAELQKLHRMAFNAALTMARLAEQAYRFERPYEAAKQGLSGAYWDAGHAGLLAGDRLMLDLQSLDRSYVETNYRTIEIEQPFSLARFDPDALNRLRTEGECEFDIPEWYFDLTYPGHYRRRIKGVRCTIPAVVGPNTNIGATLRLTGSYVRTEPRLDSQVPMPLRHVNAIATSMGQSDAGVFEFNFRDERYMPFEGAGVNSHWQLTLPRTTRTFDYGTISEVSLRISYTAEEDLELRTAAELPGGVLAALSSEGVTRVLSLRNDFRTEWNKLVDGSQTEATIEIEPIHIPFFMSAFDLEPTSFDLLVDKQPAAYPTVTFGPPATTGGGVPTAPASTAPTGSDDVSGMWLLYRTASNVPVLGRHGIRVSWAAGEPKPEDVLVRVLLKRKAA